MKITEEKIDKVVDSVVREMLTEMARLNVANDNSSPFPSDIYELKMWSNDHEPIHIHIINKQENWEVTVSLEGKTLEIKKASNKLNIQKVEKQFKTWLTKNNKYGINNKKYALSVWDSIH